MCIFSGSIREVSSTKILVSYVYPSQLVHVTDPNGKIRTFKKKTSNKPMQLVVYANSVEINSSISPVAMILPFPSNGRPKIKLLDFSRYESLFEHLESMFPQKISNDYSNSFSDDGPIEVLNVGSYKASVVPNLKAFDKLQFNQFGISSEVKNLLSRYYDKNYGFVVCILKADAKYHPFGYIHELRHDNRLFIPTRHFHGGSRDSEISHATEDETSDELTDFMQRSLLAEDEWIRHKVKKNKIRNTAKLDWDHDIYIINVNRAKQNKMFQQNYMSITSASASKVANYNKYLKLDRIPNFITFGKITDILKLNVHSGYQKNHDIII